MNVLNDVKIRLFVGSTEAAGAPGVPAQDESVWAIYKSLGPGGRFGSGMSLQGSAPPPPMLNNSVCMCGFLRRRLMVCHRFSIECVTTEKCVVYSTANTWLARFCARYDPSVGLCPLASP